jgi:plastocyanin
MRMTTLVVAFLVAGCAPTPAPSGLSPDLAQPATPPDLSVAAQADLAKAPTPDLAQAIVGATVVLKDDYYMPNMVTIPAGQKVKWSWQAAGAHGVDSVDNAFPDSPILGTAGVTSYEHTFTTPGTYQVRCLVHGAQMPMTIVVQ